MPSKTTRGGYPPTLETFLVFIKESQVDTSVEQLISLLKRRQITHAQDCAEATGRLMKVLVGRYHWQDANQLLEYLQKVGRRLSDAQPREMAVANIVRRILGMIRDEVEEDRDESAFGDSRPGSNSSQETQGTQAPFVASFKLEDSVDSLSKPRRIPTLRPTVTSSPSMFNLLASGPDTPSHTPPRKMAGVPLIKPELLAKRLSKDKDNVELKGEIIAGIDEILDELSQADDQIASYAADQIKPGEHILTYSTSITVQKFLLKTAHSRTLTVFQAATFPNEGKATLDTVTGMAKDKGGMDLRKDAFMKPLTAAGIDVIWLKDPDILGMMCSINKVIISPHIVLGNGGLVATTGARLIAKAAHAHGIPLIVLSGVYKLSPEYPFNLESLIEYGDPSTVIPYYEQDLVHSVEVANPTLDYVPPELVNLYITNLGPCAPSYLYRVIADHYKPEDINFNKPELNF